MRGKQVGLLILYSAIISLILYYAGLISLERLDTSYGNTKKLKIYMYPLNNKFNLDLSREYATWNENMLNDTGLGIALNVSSFVFNTNQFALEPYFYYRLTHSPYLTTNFEEADLYYIPFFGNLAKMAGHYPVINEFWDHMHALYKKNASTFHRGNVHKHFIVYGGCQPFAQIFMTHFLAKKITLAMLERVAPRTDTKSNVIVTPYPAQIHSIREQLPSIDFTKKTLLASSVWNSRYPFRWYLAHVICMRSNNCTHVELEPNSDRYNHSYVYELITKSVFCLNPFGDSPTRKAFWDALLVGCINVLYDTNIKYPFDDKFNYANMTVYIPKTQMNQTLNILSEIPQERIHQMQDYINAHRRHFQYAAVWHNTSFDLPLPKKDAFTMLIDEIYEHTKSIAN
eukprot:Phypoly_transcript_09548.p1 GENE.Phypoly_transcript_09548~~Phypoly_transcript_09548.p1  ORF type:complete len:399 (+),score=28.09 Phypoly_transcript_09548:124-1320(+)